VKRLVNKICRCERTAAAYRTMLYPNDYSEASALEWVLGLHQGHGAPDRVKPGFKPVRLNPYRMGPHTRVRIKAQVDRMLKLEVKKPSQSEGASPVVLIPKPDGSPRVCIDYRQLHERTVRDSYPLPRMDDCLDFLGDAQIFSTLDCNARYWQIPVAAEDKPKTAFNCHCGKLQCTRLLFGLCNAPATFQRAIHTILSGVNGRMCSSS